MKKSELRQMIREVLKEELKIKEDFSSKSDKFNLFADKGFSSELDIFILALKKHGCTDIELKIETDPYEEELPTYSVIIKDTYKLNPAKISNDVYISVIENEFGINGFIEIPNNSTDLAIGESYALDDITALTADIVNSLDFLN